MEKKSILYKIGKWWAKRKIKSCKKHQWKSFGTVRTCKICDITQYPISGHYFDKNGKMKLTGTTFQRNCAKYGHVFSDEKGQKICIVCKAGFQ